MLVYNAIACNNCHEVIESLHRHDYKVCKCGTVTIDGGLDYSICGYKKWSDVIELQVYSYQPFDIVRQFSYRLGYGNPESEDYGKYRRTFLCDMDDEYLQASIEYVGRKLGCTRHWRLLLEEKLYRIENEIKVQTTKSTLL